MVGAEILITSAVGEHVVGGGEDRGGDGDNSFFGAAACFQPQELRLKVAVLLASRGPGTLNQHRLQPWGAFSDAGRAPLAGTLVEARDETRPGQQMTRRWKLGLMSMPISARRVWAEVSLRPGTSFSRSRASRKGSSAASIRASKAAIVSSSCSMVFKCWPMRKR